MTLNGATTGTVTQGVQQNLVTTVTDTNGNTITGLTLDYQSTNPLDITASTTGGITASFPGAASVYAICQPSRCNPRSNQSRWDCYGTGLSVSSNAVERHDSRHRQRVHVVLGARASRSTSSRSNCSPERWARPCGCPMCPTPWSWTRRAPISTSARRMS